MRRFLSEPSYLTRLRRTGWLRRRDSNLCISKNQICWHFERNSISYALETDWPVEGAGFEPLHSGIEIRQEFSAWGGGISNLCISKSDLLNLILPQRVLGVDRARL